MPRCKVQAAAEHARGLITSATDCEIPNRGHLWHTTGWSTWSVDRKALVYNQSFFWNVTHWCYGYSVTLNIISLQSLHPKECCLRYLAISVHWSAMCHAYMVQHEWAAGAKQIVARLWWIPWGTMVVLPPIICTHLGIHEKNAEAGGIGVDASSYVAVSKSRCWIADGRADQSSCSSSSSESVWKARYSNIIANFNLNTSWKKLARSTTSSHKQIKLIHAAFTR